MRPSNNPTRLQTQFLSFLLHLSLTRRLHQIRNVRVSVQRVETGLTHTPHFSSFQALDLRTLSTLSKILLHSIYNDVVSWTVVNFTLHFTIRPPESGTTIFPWCLWHVLFFLNFQYQNVCFCVYDEVLKIENLYSLSLSLLCFHGQKKIRFVKLCWLLRLRRTLEAPGW